MTNVDNLKIFSGLVITGCLSGGLTILHAVSRTWQGKQKKLGNLFLRHSVPIGTIVPGFPPNLKHYVIFSLTSILLSTVALIYRFECSSGSLESSNGAQYFLLTILRIYILDDGCENTLLEKDFTSSQLVFVLTITTLVFSVVTFLTAIILISALSNEKPVQHVDIIAYIYVSLCIASLVVDLTFGVHFGMDYQRTTRNLVTSEPGLVTNYQTDLIRLGAFLLMTICLKGYIGHIISIILLVLLVIQVIEYQRKITEDEHSIHKLGVLNAFNTQSRQEDAWNSQNNNIFTGYQKPAPKRIEDPWNPQRNELYMGRGKPQTNPAFINDEHPRMSSRENGERNRPSNRSDSWLHNQINSGPALGARPFSYLEEPKRPEQMKPLTPTNDPQWRQDHWRSVPPVPDPDYSPPPRRLKSALKSNYP